MSTYLIGIDIGGTSVRFMVYDIKKARFYPIYKKSFVRSGDIEEELKENLCNIIDAIIKLMNKSGKVLNGLGISMAALFNRETGRITAWPNNTTWNGFPIRAFLEKCYNVHICMEDDSNCAALGEFWKGAGKHSKSNIYITISTGISCGIILNQSLYTGNNGWAGEIGHISLKKDGPKCICGKIGCLQSISSGPSIVNNYIKKSNNLNKKYTLPEVKKFAENGDINAIYAFKEAANYIAQMIEILTMTFDISDFVLGGGVINSENILTYAIEEEVEKRLGSNVNIMYSELLDSNGLIGIIKLCLLYLKEN